MLEQAGRMDLILKNKTKKPCPLLYHLEASKKPLCLSGAEIISRSYLEIAVHCLQKWYALEN